MFSVMQLWNMESNIHHSNPIAGEKLGVRRSWHFTALNDYGYETLSLIFYFFWLWSPIVIFHPFWQAIVIVSPSATSALIRALGKNNLDRPVMMDSNEILFEVAKMMDVLVTRWLGSLIYWNYRSKFFSYWTNKWISFFDGNEFLLIALQQIILPTLLRNIVPTLFFFFFFLTKRYCVDFANTCFVFLSAIFFNEKTIKITF